MLRKYETKNTESGAELASLPLPKAEYRQLAEHTDPDKCFQDTTESFCIPNLVAASFSQLDHRDKPLST